jgi:hypothetical protein
MPRQTFRLGWAVAVLALAAMACTCGLVQGLTQAGGSLQTVQAVATQVTTLQAAATQIATSGVVETLQAAATQAATTGALETVQAVSTDIGLGEKPEDIPIMDNPKDLFTTKELVSYTVSADFDDVVKFYRDEMAANGWEEKGDSFVSGGFATMAFTKVDREASVIISGDGGVVSIIIAISNTGQ